MAKAGGKTTRFRGPVQTGLYGGDDKSLLWDVEMMKRASVSAAKTSATVNLPSCWIQSVDYQVEIAISGTAQAPLKIGTASDLIHYGLVNVSGVEKRSVVALSGLALDLTGTLSGNSVHVQLSANAGGTTGVSLPQVSVWFKFQQAENQSTQT